jgi:hypothetical protein
MNKILFTLNVDFYELTVVANNKKDLEEFLLKKGYDYISISDEDLDGETAVVSLHRFQESECSIGKIQWIKHI